jgi:hypothetical protein
MEKERYKNDIMILFTEGLIRTESEGKSELWQW